MTRKEYKHNQYSAKLANNTYRIRSFKRTVRLVFFKIALKMLGKNCIPITIAHSENENCLPQTTVAPGAILCTTDGFGKKEIRKLFVHC